MWLMFLLVTPALLATWVAVAAVRRRTASVPDQLPWVPYVPTWTTAATTTTKTARRRVTSRPNDPYPR